MTEEQVCQLQGEVAPGEMARQWLRSQLDASGSIPALRWLGHPLRAAVIAQLYLTGRIAGDASLSVDTAPTGDRATDLVLAYLATHPNRTLDHVLRRGPALTSAVTHALVHDGTWTRRGLGRRFEDHALKSRWLPGSTAAQWIVAGRVLADEYLTTTAILVYPIASLDDSVLSRAGLAAPFLRGYLSFRAFDQADNSASAAWAAIGSSPLS